MKTIIVDSDGAVRDEFRFFMKMTGELEVVQSFNNSQEAIRYVEGNLVELAILDIQMPVMNGIELGYRLKGLQPNLVLIFVSAAENYIMDALKLKVAAYLMKPLDKEELLYGIESAKLLSRRNRKRIYARTFGYFDLFVDGKPIMFKSAKAKELLALLVDRQGGTVTTDQIISILWEERPNDEATQNLCSKVVKALWKELDDCGIGDILIRERGMRSIDVNKIDCDMYDFLEGKQEAKSHFIGDYMLEYSWAEEHMNALWRRANVC